MTHEPIGAICDYIKENLEIKVTTERRNSVKISLLLNGEVISEDTTRIDTSPLVCRSKTVNGRKL